MAKTAAEALVALGLSNPTYHEIESQSRVGMTLMSVQRYGEIWWSFKSNTCGRVTKIVILGGRDKARFLIVIHG